jgi:fermentation-respiration switch protein FrsA (DUF1100 family)
VKLSRLLPVFVLGLAALGTGCALFQHVHVPDAQLSDVKVRLHGHDLTVRLSMPDHVRQDHQVFLLYATGDAGWFGKDLAIFKEVAEWGYPAAGFSAREYVHHIGSDPLRPGQVATDFDRIIGASEKALALPPDTSVILVGKSRGAGLAVAAAGRLSQRANIEGVLAVGLTKEEEYVHRRKRGEPRGQFTMLQTYSYLPALGTLPVAVIQSSRDEYVPAAEARQLFGPETPVRHFVRVEADDHNFTGALDTMYAEMERAFQWIVER